MPQIKDLGDGHYEIAGHTFYAPTRAAAEGLGQHITSLVRVEANARRNGTVTPQQVQRVRNLLSQEEGLLRKPTPVQGNLTLGIGRDLATRGLSPEEKALLHYDTRNWDAEPLTDAEATALFMPDVQQAINDARELAGKDHFESMDEARQAAVTSLVFQMGKGGLAKFPKFLDAFRKGDYETASRELLFKDASRPNPQPSELSTQTPNRTKRVADSVQSGEWPATLPGGGL